MTNKTKQTLNKRRIITVASIIGIVAIIGVILCLYIIPTANNDYRKGRIVSIVNSFRFDESKYFFQGDYARGDVMTLDWTIRNNSVYIRRYVRNASVDTTIVEVQNSASSAGLIYVGDPYPGSSIHTFDYRTNKNEYVRIYISSKLRDDAFFNNPNMTQPEMVALDGEVNSAPSNVIININLDGIN